jgi:3-oxoacyl-[acyl-carrier protein] reductase
MDSTDRWFDCNNTWMDTQRLSGDARAASDPATLGRLDGWGALITGAGRGIGAATARELAALGAAVCVADIDAQPALDVAAEIDARGQVAFAVTTDVSSREDCERAVSLATERFGGLQILINNAGLTSDAMMAKMTDELWDEVGDVILRGAFNCIRAVAPVFRESPAIPRRIVNVASVAGIYGGIGNSNYCAAKGGVIALTRAMAKEWARYRVTVNAVAPGYVETRLTSGMPERIREVLLGRIPVGRPGVPEDIAHAIAFLCSPRSDYVTGQVLEIDGGMSDLVLPR